MTKAQFKFGRRLVRWTSLVTLTLVGLAIALFALAAADIFSAGNRLFGLALVSLDAAYFCVLAENWASGRSVPTRGGMVDKRTSPITYFFIYFVLTVVGLVALVVFLSAFLFRD